jgi:hypothetical protein
MSNPLPLQTGGRCYIDYSGLNKEDRLRIREIGLDKWLDEVTGHALARAYNKTVTTAAKEENKKSQSKLKPGSKGDVIAFAFFSLAKANKNIVTYDQCAELCPEYPGDPVAWAREAGAEVKTEKKNKRYIVVKYV